jgi:hypothetical protein
MVCNLTALCDYMKGAAHHRPQHVRYVLLQRLIVFFAQTLNPWRGDNLCHAEGGFALAVIISGGESHQWLRDSVFVCYLHLYSSVR